MGNLLWIGSYLNDEMTQEMRQIGYGNPASVLSQKNLLEGLEEVTGKTFNSIGALALSGYPKEKVKYFSRRSFSHTDGATDILVGFWNIKYVNKVLMGDSLKREVEKQLKTKQAESIDVFIYEMRSACLKAAKEVKKLCPTARVHLIVPDLPQFMDLRSNGLKRALKNIDWKNIQKNLRYIDDYILYAAPMAEYMGLKAGSWMVMEGSINQNDIDSLSYLSIPTQKNKCIVMYSGSIQKGFGIQKLLDATQLLDDSYEFWFTGGGDYKNVVREYAERDSRIKYYGFLPSREDVRRLQAQATMLINMRDPEAPASRYCFPSKLFEYMLTGKPVLSFRMGGIPEEYFSYLIGIENSTPSSIASAIKVVSAMSDAERAEFGNRGKEFVVKQKNNYEMSRRIMTFIKRGGGGVILLPRRLSFKLLYNVGGAVA